jgi:hypothetical protein
METLQNSDSAFRKTGKRGGRTRLYVEVACEQCKRTRALPKHNFHPPLCRRCDYKQRSSGPVKVTCRGSNPYHTELPLDLRPHADGCKPDKRETWKARKQINDSQRRYNTALDESARVYRSKPCANVVNGIRYQERRAEKFLTEVVAPEFSSSPERRQYFFEQTGGKKGGGFYPHEAMPRIRSSEGLHERLSQCQKLGDEIGKEFNPKRFKPGDERFKSRKKARKRKDSSSQRNGLIRKYARGEIRRRKKPQTLKGPCLHCHTFIPSNGRRPVWFHDPCYDDVTRGLLGVKEKNPKDSLKALKGKRFRYLVPPKQRKRGGQATRRIAQKHWDWANRLYSGETASDIANSLGNHPSTVERGIESLLPVLPSDPKFVREKFRDRFIGICELAMSIQRKRSVPSKSLI